MFINVTKYVTFIWRIFESYIENLVIHPGMAGFF
jgi:hypothetical protein